MSGPWIGPVVVSTALGAALVGGIFFAFSTFVMTALGRLPPEQGIAAMRSINVTVLNPWFFAAFFGTALGAAALALFGFLNWDAPGAAYLVAGGLFYVIGSILVTAAFNVPLNDALAAAQAGVDIWPRYLATWTTWNHVRTIASLGAAVSFIMASR